MAKIHLVINKISKNNNYNTLFMILDLAEYVCNL